MVGYCSCSVAMVDELRQWHHNHCTQRLFKAHDPTRGSGQEIIEKHRCGRVGSGRVGSPELSRSASFDPIRGTTRKYFRQKVLLFVVILRSITPVAPRVRVANFHGGLQYRVPRLNWSKPSDRKMPGGEGEPR